MNTFVEIAFSFYSLAEGIKQQSMKLWVNSRHIAEGIKQQSMKMYENSRQITERIKPYIIKMKKIKIWELFGTLILDETYTLS